MIIEILASLIIFSLVLSHTLKRRKREDTQTIQDFWARERQADSVRRKPLDNLEYITIPMDRMPTELLPDNAAVQEYLDILKTLSTQGIVNLTGYSNTDLKLEYGTANITILSEYDQNYTVLVRTLQQWADILLENGCTAEAETIMEFAIGTRTDVSRTYYKLADIYAVRLETEKIRSLVETAETLHSANKNAIVRTLQESYL